MSFVFKGRLIETGRPVAVKILSPEKARDESFLAQFTLDAQVGLGLGDPRHAEVYSTGVLGGFHYAAIEYVDGPDLFSLVADSGPLPPAEVAAVLATVSGLLHDLHQRHPHYLFLDLTSVNILRENGSGRYVVIDLFTIERHNGGQFQPGELIGTPEFLSPEQVELKALDIRTELYSLGIMAHYLALGTLPFSGGSASETLDLILTRSVPQDTFARRGIPEALGAIILRLLQKDPAARPAGHGELLRGLQPLMSEPPVIEDPEPERKKQKGPVNTLKVALAVMALLVVVLGALLAVGLTQRMNDTAASAPQELEMGSRAFGFGGYTPNFNGLDASPQGGYSPPGQQPKDAPQSVAAAVPESLPLPGAMAQGQEPFEGEQWIEPKTGMRFVYIGGNSFTMTGTLDASSEMAMDPHPVRLDGFWIGVTEVTNEQYSFLKQIDYSLWEVLVDSKDFSRKDHPAVCISWQDCKRFARLLSDKDNRFRLPTEAEWEYASFSGGMGVAYTPEGQGLICQYANVRDRTLANNEFFIREASSKKIDECYTCADGFAFTAPVGSFPPNRFQLHDMLGNAAEWVLDSYSPTAYRNAPLANPVVTKGEYRLARGGDWSSNMEVVSKYTRIPVKETVRLPTIGFRLVREKVR